MKYREYFAIEVQVESCGPLASQRALEEAMRQAKKRFQFPEPISHSVLVFDYTLCMSVIFGANI
jgi:alkylation response protein AidB-like acyl-CoA dehydrogenase